MGDDIQAKVSELRERWLRWKARAEQGVNATEDLKPSKKAERREYYHCPACGRELDTGWECNHCGADWMAEATGHTGDGYDSLRAVYTLALEQAQGGKGKERHATSQPFDQQPICQGGRRFGVGCLIYQAWKKAHETPVLLGMDNGKERAVCELLGVINYAAAAILVIKEGGDAVE